MKFKQDIFYTRIAKYGTGYFVNRHPSGFHPLRQIRLRIVMVYNCRVRNTTFDYTTKRVYLGFVK